MHIPDYWLQKEALYQNKCLSENPFFTKMYVELCQKHMEHHQPFFAHAQFTRVLNVFDLLEMYCFGACENLR